MAELAIQLRSSATCVGHPVGSLTLGLTRGRGHDKGPGESGKPEESSPAPSTAQSQVKPQAHHTSTSKTVRLRRAKLGLTIRSFPRDYPQTAGSQLCLAADRPLSTVFLHVSCLLRIQAAQETDCLAIPWLRQRNQPSIQTS